MKILVNGYTVTENLKLRRNKEDIRIAEIMIEHIKRNKVMYVKLIFTTALMLHFNSFIFANEVSATLDSVGYQIIDMLSGFAKWGCVGMGLKSVIFAMLNGANLKQASTEGIQYFLGYLFIQFYPSLFEMFATIKFNF